MEWYAATFWNLCVHGRRSGLYSRQATAHEMVFGGAWMINADNIDPGKPTNVYLGSWARFSKVTDAIIPYVGLDFGSFSLGMTYDVNISAFKAASQYQRGIEISLMYIGKSSDNRHRETPCRHF